MEQTNLESALYGLLLGLGAQLGQRLHWCDLQELMSLDQAAGDESAAQYTRAELHTVMLRRRALFPLDNKPALGIQYTVEPPLSMDPYEGTTIDEIIRNRTYPTQAIAVYVFDSVLHPHINFQDWDSLGDVLAKINLETDDWVHVEFEHEMLSYGVLHELVEKYFVDDWKERNGAFFGNGTTETVIAGLHYLLTNANQILL